MEEKREKKSRKKKTTIFRIFLIPLIGIIMIQSIITIGTLVVRRTAGMLEEYSAGMMSRMVENRKVVLQNDMIQRWASAHEQEMLLQETLKQFLGREGLALEEKDKEFFRTVSMDMDNSSATLSLHYLSKYLYLYYGKKVIILLDEYDTPMQEAYINGFWEEMVSFTRSLFNSTFKTNPWLERAVMTGITRVSKESIFSDLNNLEVVTTTCDKYETTFGFTEDEVFHALDEFEMPDKKDEVKEWYDGFIFGKVSDIYNPWSILNYLDKKKLGIYWANTSSNSLVGKLIREGSPDVKVVMEGLLLGNAFHTVIDEQIVFNQLDYLDSAVWSLLLASGYLKAETYQMNLENDQEEYDLVLTNREVRVMFKRMINSNALIKVL